MTKKSYQMLSRTESLCPRCLSRIPAYYVKDGEMVYLIRHCDDHGGFQTMVWKGPPNFETWKRPKIPTSPPVTYSESYLGCPFDCGLCPAHRQHTCTALIEITQRCNLNCPVCFASAGRNDSADPDLGVIKEWFERIRDACHPCNIQISGGEPTLRDDLPEIITLGGNMGFSFIQLNTNGIRLAGEKGYARKLKEAGLSSVFLQFDGTEDSVYNSLRGKPLLDIKQSAIEMCGENDIGVVLVPTLVPGVNSRNIGDIIRFGLKKAPVVRGIHFQPISYFGRYPHPPTDGDRISLPEIMTAMEEQTGGMIKANNFRPPGCENARCSFHGNFILMPDGKLKALSCFKPPATLPAMNNGFVGDLRKPENISSSSSDYQNIAGNIEKAEDGARQAISTVARQWAFPVISDKKCCCGTDDLDTFLSRAKQYGFTISAMAFQDAWNIDLERLKDCCIHVMAPGGKLVPFCIYNLTSAEGKTVYRK